jgi:hypothetical protein
LHTFQNQSINDNRKYASVLYATYNQFASKRLSSLASERLTDLSGEVIHAERLLEKMHTFFQYSMMNYNIGGVSGHEKNFYLRSDHSQLIS